MWRSSTLKEIFLLTKKGKDTSSERRIAQGNARQETNPMT